MYPTKITMTAMTKRRVTAPATAKIATGLLSSPKIDRTCPTRESREKPTTIYTVHLKLEYSPDFSIVRTEVLLEFLTLPSSIRDLM